MEIENVVRDAEVRNARETFPAPCTRRLPPLELGSPGVYANLFAARAARPASTDVNPHQELERANTCARGFALTQIFARYVGISALTCSQSIIIPKPKIN